MSAILTIGREPAQGPVIAHRALTALWKVWATYTLKRAIADVGSTSDQDYRDFGFDKAEILGALRSLHEQVVASRETVAAAHAPDAAVRLTLRLRTGGGLL